MKNLYTKIVLFTILGISLLSCSVTKNLESNSLILRSNKIRSSTGVGLDWITPIGPLSFSLSQTLTKKSTDMTESFRFNLGFYRV